MELVREDIKFLCVHMAVRRLGADCTQLVPHHNLLSGTTMMRLSAVTPNTAMAPPKMYGMYAQTRLSCFLWLFKACCRLHHYCAQLLLQMKRRGLLPPDTTMESLVQKAEGAAVDFMDTEAAAESLAGGSSGGGGDGGVEMKERRAGEQSRRAYLRELRKVVDHSDVILQVRVTCTPWHQRYMAYEAMPADIATARYTRSSQGSGLTASRCSMR